MKFNLMAGISLIISLSFFPAGCAPVVLKNSYGNYYARLASDRYEGEINRLTALTDEKSPTFRPDSYLYLSFLYSSYNNPKKDYAMALKAMERYISFVPAGSRSFEVQNLLILLREINGAKAEGLEQIKIEKVNLKSKDEALAKKEGKIKALEETINQLNETIDKLKNLDMELEKKRKSFR
ncbi:MAG: hypothetical protein OEV42_13530 [Deltaproteobacteria bacterium]|nr:hypothetical protein [Deltaproteobacteria bacterium]